MARFAAAQPLRAATVSPGGGWVAVSVAIAIVLAIPVAVVAGSVFLPGGEAWDHLVATVLPEYVATTLVLLAAVIAG